MESFDGPTLRAVREGIGVPLRRIARQAGMSHGHLSKVERGEHGRPVTPAILAAYERVTGVKLAEAAVKVAEDERQAGRRLTTKMWRIGQLTDMRRVALTAAFGALSIGGYLGEPVSRLIDSTGRTITPTPPVAVDVEQLERLTTTLTVLDLRFGGGLVSQTSKAVLRWAVPMLDAAQVSNELRRRIAGAVSGLALRCAWSAFDAAAHESARSLFRLASFTAVQSGDRDLRAHVLADAAAQYNYTGYHHDGLDIIRMVEGDERVSPAVRMVVHGVKARSYASAGEAGACRRHIELADQAYADADERAAGWVGKLRHPGHLYAATGHALAVLAIRNDAGEGVGEARERLVKAVDAFDPAVHARALALCTTRLASLHLDTGELGQGAEWARLAVRNADGITSVRLARDLAAIRKSAASHPDQPAMSELVAEIDTAGITDADEQPAEPTSATRQPAPARG
jgi:transcriptional regulator with XRE-family HTH domain